MESQTLFAARTRRASTATLSSCQSAARRLWQALAWVSLRRLLAATGCSRRGSAPGCRAFPDSFVLAASCNAQGEGSSKGGREGGCQGTRAVPGEMAQYLGIGNAVSPPVVRAIARAVLDAVLGEEDETC